VREKASRQLIALGIVTRDALERATRQQDAEVRARARAILEVVCESDFQNRLAAFSADYDGRLKQTLPAWDQFSAQVGDGRLSRQLFVEMQRAEPELLEAMAEGPKPASAALADRTEQLLAGRGETLSMLGTQASLLFVAGAEGVEVSQLGSLNVYPYIVQSAYQRNRKSPLWPGPLKKIVGNWLAKDDTPEAVVRNLVFATDLELKDEALTIAMRILSSGDSPAKSRMLAIRSVAIFGGPSQRPILEKLLADATSCGMVQAVDASQPVEQQVRDVALAALLHLTGQNLTEYGFGSAEPYGQDAFQMGAIGFADAKLRDAALAKWAKWRAEHPDH